MKILALIFIIGSQVAWASSPQDFNKELLHDVREDIKQDRYHKGRSEIIRKPASIEREELLDQKELQRKNKVNGLHEKW